MDTEILGLIGIAISGLLAGLLLLGFLTQKKRINAIFEASQRKLQKLWKTPEIELDKIVKNALREAKEEHQRRRKQFEQYELRQGEVSKLESRLKSAKAALRRSWRLSKSAKKILSNCSNQWKNKRSNTAILFAMRKRQ